MTSRQAFRALAHIYRKIGSLGFTPGKATALAKNLDAIADLDLPGQAGAVLAGLEAQGADGWCEEMCSHLRRLGVEAGTLQEAAAVWKAIMVESAEAVGQNQAYRSAVQTYGRGLAKIKARMAQANQEEQGPADFSAQTGVKESDGSSDSSFQDAVVFTAEGTRKEIRMTRRNETQTVETKGGRAVTRTASATGAKSKTQVAAKTRSTRTQAPKKATAKTGKTGKGKAAGTRTGTAKTGGTKTKVGATKTSAAKTKVGATKTGTKTKVGATKTSAAKTKVGATKTGGSRSKAGAVKGGPVKGAAKAVGAGKTVGSVTSSTDRGARSAAVNEHKPVLN